MIASVSLCDLCDLCGYIYLGEVIDSEGKMN